MRTTSTAVSLKNAHARIAVATLAALAIASSTRAVADDAQDPVLINAPVQKVFVPLGFDNNDDVEVVVHGHFPNTCYKIGPAKAIVDDAAKTVTLVAQAFYYSQAVCLQVLVPFSVPVKIGPMKQGDYQVSVLGSPDAETTQLNIGVATTSDPDDFIYAPVDAVDLAPNAAGQMTLTLQGVYPYTFVGCMVMDRVTVAETPGNVLVVQPIAKFTDGDECLPQRDSKKFVVRQAVDLPLAFTEYLIHVRVLAGNSINRLIEIER